MASRQKIKTFLWFDKDAEEAAKFYTSIFKNSRITAVARYGDAGPGPKGSAMTVAFELEGQEFLALNGGPQFKFTEAISLLVTCESQQEIDELWGKLTAGGRKDSAGGSRTATDSPGRSSPPPCRTSCRTPTRRSRPG